MPGRFRLTKSKFQIFTILSSFPNSPNSSQFFQKFHFLPVFSFFSKFFLYPLIWFLPRAVVFFSKMITVAPKILLLFQILAVIFSWDWSWEFDRSWSGPYQKFLKLENFRRYLQLGKELESYDNFNLNAQNFQILEKLRIYFKMKKIWKAGKFWRGWNL